MSRKSVGIYSGIFWLICLATPGWAQQQQHIGMETLISVDQGKHRFLLVFSPNDQNQIWQKQARLLRQAHLGLADRDMVVVQVVENSVDITPAITKQLPRAAALRDTYQVNPKQFTLILVGKDGGEKYRAAQAQALAVLFGLVDAMPMRRQEMHEKPGG